MYNLNFESYKYAIIYASVLQLLQDFCELNLKKIQVLIIWTSKPIVCLSRFKKLQKYIFKRPSLTENSNKIYLVIQLF